MPWTVCSFALLLALLPVVGETAAAVVLDSRSALYDEDAVRPRPVARVRAELVAGDGGRGARWLRLTISAFGAGVDPVPGLAGVPDSNLRTAEEIDRLLRERALRLVVHRGGQELSAAAGRVTAIRWQRVPQRSFAIRGVAIGGSTSAAVGATARAWPTTVVLQTGVLPAGVLPTGELPGDDEIRCYLEAGGVPRLVVELARDRIERVASLAARREQSR